METENEIAYNVAAFHQSQSQRKMSRIKAGGLK